MGGVGWGGGVGGEGMTSARIRACSRGAARAPLSFATWLLRYESTAASSVRLFASMSRAVLTTTTKHSAGRSLSSAMGENMLAIALMQWPTSPAIIDSVMCAMPAVTRSTTADLTGSRSTMSVIKASVERSRSGTLSTRHAQYTGAMFSTVSSMSMP